MREQARRFIYSECRYCYFDLKEIVKRCPKCQSSNLSYKEIEAEEFCRKFNHDWHDVTASNSKYYLRCIRCGEGITGLNYCKRFGHEGRSKNLILQLAGTLRKNKTSYEADFLEVCARCNVALGSFTAPSLMKKVDRH